MSSHEVDKASEKLIAESQRELLPMANAILEELSEKARVELSEPLLNFFDKCTMLVLMVYAKIPDILQHFLPIPVNPASYQRIERIDRLHALANEAPEILRCALAVSELSLTFSTLLSMRLKETVAAEIQRNQVRIEKHPKEFIPVSYFVSRISEATGASEETADEIWKAFAETLLQGRASLPGLKVKEIKNNTAILVLDYEDDDDSDSVIIEH